MRLYLYALAGHDPLDLPPGIEERPVLVIPYREISLLASQWDDSPPPPISRSALIAHEHVIETAMQTTTVLPFRFGTLSSEELARAFMEAHAPEIQRRLERVAKQVEVTLKVIDPAETAPKAERYIARTGTEYLMQKQQDLHHDHVRLEQAQRLVADIESALAPWITDRYHRLFPTDQVVAAITHLIPETAVASWTQAVERLRPRFPMVQFMASGPWPPYHFAEVTQPGTERSESHPGSAGRR
jgi:hypothetical protein